MGREEERAHTGVSAIELEVRLGTGLKKRREKRKSTASPPAALACELHLIFLN